MSQLEMKLSTPKFTGEGYSNGETISFAVSNGNNALNWTEVNGGNPYLTSTVGTKGVRDPSIIRAHNGSKFWLLATVSILSAVITVDVMTKHEEIGLEDIWKWQLDCSSTKREPFYRDMGVD